MPKDVDSDAQVTVVTVTFNSLAVLPEMLDSVPAGVKVIVVDNASEELADLRTICDSKGAVLLRNDQNIGFGRACNQGAGAADSEFVFFLNPDATLMPDTILQLVEAARRNPRASAMNPRIASANGAAFFHRSTPLMPRSDYMPRGWPSADKEVTVLTGAALFVRRSDFEAVGGFDPKIFLYHEDDDLSLRLRQERGPTMFVYDAFVRHRGGASTPRRPEISALKAFHMARSAVYATRKHGRPLPFLRALLKAVTGLLSLDMIWSQRRRAKNWAFLKGVLSTLRDGGAA